MGGVVGEGSQAWGQLSHSHQAGPLPLLSPPPSADCYVDLRGSPAPLPSTPTMSFFPHVLDLLAPLDSSSRAVPSTESLDDFSDGDLFGPELDTLLDSLVSRAAPSCPPEPCFPVGPHGHPHPQGPRGVEGRPRLHVTGRETEAPAGICCG